MPSDLSVLHVLAPAPVGGLERVVRALATGQRERGVDARVAAVVDASADGEHPFVGDLRAASVPVEAVPVPRRSYARELGALTSVFRRVGPEVVHTHGYRADVLAGGLARRLGLPTVSTAHGFTGGGWKNRFYEWLQRRSLARAEEVVAVSRGLERELLEAGVDGDRLHVVHNAWRPNGPLMDRSAARERLGLSEEPFVVGWVGRLSREKGPDVLVRCAAEVDDGGTMFSVIGEGPGREELRSEAGRLGVGDRVSFHGLVPDAAAVYRAFDAFALSSRTEGVPVSLFEAMEAEVPVVATAVGGVPDVVRDGREGLLVPPEDPRALARAIDRVRRDPEASRERARRARRRLEREFAPGPWLDRYHAIYRKAVEGT